MQPDEILRLDYSKCIVLFQGHKPALLYKLTPEELPDYGTLKSCRVIDYIPEWKAREQSKTKGASTPKDAAATPENPPQPRNTPIPAPPPVQAKEQGGKNELEIEKRNGSHSSEVIFRNPSPFEAGTECDADSVIGMDEDD